MCADADSSSHRKAQEKLITQAESDQSEDEPSTVYGKVSNDTRITWIGRIIRRTSIDELPQLVNVIKGEMSLVGPRPSVLYELEYYELWHRERLKICPGITGLWQVSGRSSLTFEQMVRLDIEYIENWSLLLDVKILFLTIPAVLRVGEAP
jgi:lipopolysaccharide/colanic/teichoic acid biosynthesis glycosyltransferase